MKKVLFAAMGVAALSPLGAQTQPPAKIDVSSLPAQASVIDNVVVPVPSEVFSVLDKIGKPHWNDVLRPTSDKTKISSEQPQIALQLGAVIAEGFIAVEAEDASEVKKIGGNVRKLAKAIAVEKAVIDRAKAITDNADKKDWVAVRKELDLALRDVKKAMTELQNADLAHLVSIGGWLRGTEALTQVVANSNGFDKTGAELLHQPALLNYFDQQLDRARNKFKSNQLITDVQKGVKDIRPLIGIENGDQISEKSVKEVGDISGRLIKSINSK